MNQAQPDFALFTVPMTKPQPLKVKASPTATMDTHLRMKTKIKEDLADFL